MAKQKILGRPNILSLMTQLFYQYFEEGGSLQVEYIDGAVHVIMPNVAYKNSELVCLDCDTLTSDSSPIHETNR